MLGESIVKNFGNISKRTICRDLLISIVLGLAISTAILLSILIPSGGTEPRGICDFVLNDAGLLPLNPNEGGTYKYSCNPKIVLMLFYIVGPALVILSIAFFVIQFLRPIIKIFRRDP